MNTKTTTHGDMLRAHADIEDYRSRGDFTSQYLRDAAGIIDAQAEEIERLRSIQHDIGGIGGCADGSGMRAVAAVAEANKRADKAQSRVAELEAEVERLRDGGSFHDFKQRLIDTSDFHAGVEVGAQQERDGRALAEEYRNRAEARVAELERELALSAQRNAALLSDKDAVGAVLRTDSSLADLEGRLQNVVAEWRDRSANMPTNGYYNALADLSESETLGGCADEIDAILAKREGGR